MLSIEDVACILHISESTVKRYKQALSRGGTPLILRGDTADMGPGTCHRVPIIELFLQGYAETEIAQHPYTSLNDGLGLVHLSPVEPLTRLKLGRMLA